LYLVNFVPSYAILIVGTVLDVTNVTPGIVPVTCSIAQPGGGKIPLPVSKLSDRSKDCCANPLERKSIINRAINIDTFMGFVNIFMAFCLLMWVQSSILIGSYFLPFWVQSF
jgi:hypothetical protein